MAVASMEGCPCLADRLASVTFMAVSPNGGDPPFYAPRRFISNSVANLCQELIKGRQPAPVAILGSRGSGKTVELRRARETAIMSGIHVVSIVLRYGRELGEQISQALAWQLGERISRSPRKVSASGEVPFTGIKLGFESSTNAQFPSLGELLAKANKSQVAHSGMLFLIDEGDFLTEETLDSALCDLLRASDEAGVAVSACVAGSGYSFLSALRGKSTFMQTLFNTVPLVALSPEESTDLIVSTAASLNRVWDGASLAPLVRVCRGNPRFLQNGIALLMESSHDPDKGRVETVADSLASRIAILEHHLDQPARALIKALDELFAGGKELDARQFFDRFYELGFTDEDRRGGPLDWLFQSGRIEFDENFRFCRRW